MVDTGVSRLIEKIKIVSKMTTLVNRLLLLFFWFKEGV